MYTLKNDLGILLHVLLYNPPPFFLMKSKLNQEHSLCHGVVFYSIILKNCIVFSVYMFCNFIEFEFFWFLIKDQFDFTA